MWFQGFESLSLLQLMSFRICRTNDICLVKRLDESIFEEGLYGMEEATWWIAWHKGTPVAYAGVMEHTKNYAYLCRAGVVPEARGHGLQRKLIRKRVEYAKSLDYKGVVTYTIFHNNPSSNNLIKEGFLLFDPLDPWSVEDEPVLYWIKEFGE